MKDENCIFCKLANGDIPTNSIYEDDDFNVILDASPASKGHALILPKQHYANVYEIDDEVLAKAAKLAKKIIVHEKEILGCDGYNIVQNNGRLQDRLFSIFICILYLDINRMIMRMLLSGSIRNLQMNR